MSKYYPEREVMSDKNSNYDRKLAKEYAEKYALVPNRGEYPYFEKDDCANFISQVLRAGGIEEVGLRWDKPEAWFCRTKNTKDLKNIAITWRAARYFRRHWGNENGTGQNRAAASITITAQQALDNFDRLYTLLKEGDVIQYGNPKNKNYPYHTQVIHEKGLNYKLNRYDLFLAQHTQNRLYVSLYRYLSKLEDKEIRPVYIYRIKDD
jgi:hypothetical protein